jgi:hypothetical protein
MRPSRQSFHAMDLLGGRLLALITISLVPVLSCPTRAPPVPHPCPTRAPPRASPVLHHPDIRAEILFSLRTNQSYLYDVWSFEA